MSDGKVTVTIEEAFDKVAEAVHVLKKSIDRNAENIKALEKLIAGLHPDEVKYGSNR